MRFFAVLPLASKGVPLLRLSPLRLLATAFVCLALLGCSNKKFDTHPVAGTVKFEDGSPVKFGRVEFFSKEQQVSARGSIKPDGTFAMGTEEEDDGAVAGKHQVLIVQVIAPSESGVTPHEHGTHISTRFATFKSSGLTFTVQPDGENVAEFVVQKQELPNK